ncbi:hypothetical protein EZJ49_03740 [Bdellovibrio bacteriovorus]|uniref:hypothetical protein n=1 Tax=Bdellovibrio bacteriovorus TaxID=959 RepID=UPI0021D0EAE2|nr:hypothetical protein [Bdellovibrio bacteriovorus]UXR65363.1 hypothetical protein EZJ49_03740 [Bdellovibrio bacteriovorus]
MKFIAAFLCSMVLQAQAAWDLNDVSYLMPLPTQMGEDSLLKLESSARGGSLLPTSFVNQIPVLAIDRSRDELNSALRVVGVRIDPCFPLPTPQSCQRQIRLVWQPVELSRRNEIQSVDAALHSFYVLQDWEFASLLKELTAWKKKYAVNTAYLPLQVHPAWKEQGDAAPAFADFNKIILKYAGAENFTRVTAMVLRGNADMWAFAGFEPTESGKLQMLRVPRLGDRMAQSFINLAVPHDHFAGGGIAPSPKGPDTFSNLTGESIRLEEPGTEELIRKEVRAAFRVENPKNFTPENMDCVSCHVAQPAIQWVLNKRPELKVDQLWSSEIYANAKYNLGNTSPEVWNTQQIRAFGYFGRNVAISQRAINESAEVADFINRITAQE